MRLSKREKGLLYILLLVLIAAGILLVSQRLTSQIETLETEYTTVLEESMKVRSALNALDTLRTTLPEQKAAIAEMYGELHKLMRNRQVDTLLTDLALANELSPVSLTMNGAQLLPVGSYTMDAKVKQETETNYVYTATAVLTATGSKSSCYSYIDALSALDGVRLSGFTLTSPASGSKYTMTFTVSVFMYDSNEGALHA